METARVVERSDGDDRNRNKNGSAEQYSAAAIARLGTVRGCEVVQRRSAPDFTVRDWQGMSEVPGRVAEKEGGEARHGRGRRRHSRWPEPGNFPVVPGKRAILQAK